METSSKTGLQALIPKYVLGFPMGLKLHENQNIGRMSRIADVAKPKTVCN